MSAKERLAAFQSKTENSAPVKKSVQGPRKIGKLNIPGQKPVDEKPKAAASPKKKIVKKKVVKKSADVNGNTKTAADENKNGASGSQSDDTGVTVSSEGHESSTSPQREADMTSTEAAAPIAEVVSESSCTDVTISLKDTELDLKAEFEANVDLVSPVTSEAVADVVDAEVVFELKPTAMEPVEGETLTVAGILPVGESPAVLPESLHTVEGMVATVAGIPPVDETPVVIPTSLKDVEGITTTVAGIAPGKATEDKPVVPTLGKSCEGDTVMVAGISPPSQQAGDKPKSITTEEKTMVVAGITPGVKESAKQQGTKLAVTVSTGSEKAKPDSKVATPKSLGKVEAKTMTVAGIAPKGSAKLDQKQVEQKPMEQKPAQVKAVEDKPREARKRPPQAAMKREIKAIPEEFFDNLFYFSGMGTVVGSALSKGVYVPIRNTNTALDIEVIESYEAQKDEEIARGVRVVKKARNEAVDLAEELRKLQSLLSGLPTFGADAGQTSTTRTQPLPPKSTAAPRRVEVPALDLIAKRVESVAKDIPAVPRVVYQPPRAAPAPAPIRSAFTPVKAPAPVASQPPLRAPVPVPAPAPVRAPVWHPVEPRVPPISGVPSNVGVFKGAATDSSKSNVSWQQRYGGKNVTDAQAPKPFGAGGDIPSGLKPWELSRLRGLEARGFEFKHEFPQSGADHSDDFYHGGSHMSVGTGSEPADDDIASYAPFLVSSRSKKRDRAHMLHHDAVRGASFSPASHLLASPIPGPHMMMSPASSIEVPYCDL